MVFFIAGSIGLLINEKDVTMVKYLEKMGKWPEVNSMYKKLLEERLEKDFL